VHENQILVFDLKQHKENILLTCPYGKFGIWTSFIRNPAKITKAEGIVNMPRAP
jgi:hypothetical protein